MSLFTERRRRREVSYLREECRHTLTNSVVRSFIHTPATVSLSLTHTHTHTHTETLADLTRYMVNLSLKRRHLIHQKKKKINSRIFSTLPASH